MPRRVPDRAKGAIKALRSAGVTAKNAAKATGVSEKTAKRLGGGKTSSLMAPLAGAASSSRALNDLEELRTILFNRIRTDDVSPRDLAGLSAEIRKVDASITQLELLSKAGDEGEPEEVRDAAARVRAKLEAKALKTEPTATAEEVAPIARVAS